MAVLKYKSKYKKVDPWNVRPRIPYIVSTPSHQPFNILLYIHVQYILVSVEILFTTNSRYINSFLFLEYSMPYNLYNDILGYVHKNVLVPRKLNLDL